MRKLVPFAVVAALAATSAVARDRVERVVCGDNDGIPYEAGVFSGTIRSIRDNVLRIGEVRVVLAQSDAEYDWYCGGADWESIDLSERRRVGDVVSVIGSLREDGSILAYEIWHEGLPDAQPTTRTGVVDDVDATFYPDETGGTWEVNAFTVDGTEYRASYDNQLYTQYTTETDDPGEVRVVQPGDAVCVDWRFDENGVRWATYVTVRPPGDGTVVEGVVGDDENYFFDVGGIPCLDQQGTSWGGYSYLLDNFDDWTGLRVRVKGILRDGHLLAHRIDCLGRAGSIATKARRGRLKANGRLDAVRAGGATVCGLDLETPVRHSETTVGRCSPGDRVRVEGQLRGGRAIATRIRKR